MDSRYTPIDCALHDELQLLALRRRRVSLSVAGEDGAAEPLEGALVDVFSRDGAEWIRLASGREIRLDRLLEVDGRRFRPAPGEGAGRAPSSDRS